MDGRDDSEGAGARILPVPVPATQRLLAMAAHLSMWLGAVLAASLDLRWLLSLWLLPGCLWLLARQRMRFAAAHCEQALALGGGVSMLCALLLVAILSISGATPIVLPALLCLLGTAVVWSLIAMVAAVRGRRYRNPVLRLMGG